MDEAPRDGSPHKPRDAVSVLTVYLVVLLGIPSMLRVAILGAAGAPANLLALGLGLGLIALWLIRRPGLSQASLPGVVIAAFAFLFAILLSYLSAMTRPIQGVEVSQAATGILRILGPITILALTSVYVPNLERLATLVNRIVLGGAALATLGILQFATKQTLVDRISIPGLSGPTDGVGGGLRSGLFRAFATATHPLELVVVLSIVLPLALTRALYSMRIGPFSRWYPVAAVASGAMVTGSRSALLGLLVSFVVMFFFWPPVIRVTMGVVGLSAAGAFVATVPALFNTMKSLVVSSRSDPSALSRVDSLPAAMDFFSHHPWIGRGFGTFLPDFRILDNQWLLLLVDTGMIGVGCLIVLILTACVSGLRASRSHPDPYCAQLGPALVAGLLGAAVCLLFFDAFSFSMAAGMIFLALGLAGACARLLRAESATA